MIIKFKKVLRYQEVLSEPFTFNEGAWRIHIPEKVNTAFYFHCEFYPCYIMRNRFILHISWNLEGKKFAEIIQYP